MKLDYSTTTALKKPTGHIGRRNAYHQAGRVAAIYLGSKQKGLPAVHFQIVIKPAEQGARFDDQPCPISHKYRAKLEGGRLIPDLPHAYQSATQLLSPTEQHQCQRAFEADVVNLLAASLAEAKYVALRDDEVFNANLVYLGALKFYGGQLDLLTVDEYMDCLYPANKTERDQKLAELFLAAYSFVNEPANWQAITTLADTLYRLHQEVVTCEELIALLERPYATNMERQSGTYAEKLSRAVNHQLSSISE